MLNKELLGRESYSILITELGITSGAISGGAGLVITLEEIPGYKISGRVLSFDFISSTEQETLPGHLLFELRH